ncbi:2-oxo-tetronate isomerase [Loktanella sp. Alg231-35]|uniref:2-oxo-tetronate isomerase n=1 Tax=Loktanella sp. Alg231-35 TaxID=1922220 RepID=UPI000D5517DC|nr:2-oxo-tetronate isomerase [Loktanella sp. Alg231-35]
MSLKFAANLSFMFTELPFHERFQAAANAGFRGVEFLFPYAYSPTEIAEFVQRAGLTLVLHNLPPGDWVAGDRGIAALVGRQQEFRASVETALSYADVTGLRQMHIMAGCVDDLDRDSAREIYLENLNHAARRFANAGLTALIEPINTTDMPGYFLNHPHEAHQLFSELGEPNLRLQFDCYHAQIMGGDAVGALEMHFPCISHIQIASVPDRHEPDHGDCDYAAVFSTLKKLSYTGWIGCEYHPAGRTEAGLAWRAR